MSQGRRSCHRETGLAAFDFGALLLQIASMEAQAKAKGTQFLQGQEQKLQGTGTTGTVSCVSGFFRAACGWPPAC